MAYDYVEASTESHYVDSWTAVTAPPFSMSCWCYPDAAASEEHVMSINDNSSVDLLGNLAPNGDGIDNKQLSAQSYASGWDRAPTTNTWTQSAWNHFGGSWAVNGSDMDIVSVLNGDWANGGSVTTSGTETGIDRLSLGAQAFSGSQQNHYDGGACEYAVWNAVLTQAEWEALAKGYSALFIRPQSLVFYAPMIRNLQDIVGGMTISTEGTPTVIEHPRIIYPSAMQLLMPSAAPAPGGAAIMNQIQGSNLGSDLYNGALQ